MNPVAALNLKGSQIPRIAIEPGWEWTDADDAAFLVAGYGLPLDDWQHLVLRAMLARTGPEWACRQVGVSVPRQNGKNGVVEARELFGLIALGEHILHTAHTVGTARKAFLRILHFLDNDKYPELKETVAHIRRANGQEMITMGNGGTIEFSARATNTGRGFSVDMIVFDEAQHLSEEGHEALLPTISASSNAQTIYIGTPPGPMVKGEIFTRLRNSARERLNPKLAWYEWSLDENKPRNLDDESLWAAVNPAYGFRIHADAIRGERASFSDEGFERERLGIWHDYASMRTVIDMRKWHALCNKDSGIERERDIVIAVDMPPTRDSVSIALCGKQSLGTLPHLEVVPTPRMTRGTGWSLDWVAERAKRWRAKVVIDTASPASTLIPALRARGIDVLATNVKEMGQACGMLWDAVESGDLAHLGQPGLDAALIGARRRDLGDGAWGWHRRKSDIDISPLVSFTLAHYGWRIERAAKKSQRKTIVSMT